MLTIKHPDAKVGDQLPELTLTITRAGVVRYAGASTDFNPIHFSDFYATQLGLTGCIAHGMWTMGAALRIVTDWVGDPALVKSYFVRFTKPVPVPDDNTGTEVKVSAKISAIAGGVATISIEATCLDAKVLGAAKAEVELPTLPLEAASCSVEHLDAQLSDALTNLALVEPADPASTKLADHTTFRLGGQASRFVTVETEADLVDAVRACDARQEPLLVLSGGSNIVVADEPFPGTVVKVAVKGMSADVSGCGGAVVTVKAGERWDDFVQFAISQEWSGLEALSGIPGLVGSTPIQNVGAYGAQVSDVVTKVRTLDRQTGQFKTFPLVDCHFGYRTSIFKQSRLDTAPTGRYVVLDVTFQMLLGNMSAPIKYRELADRLGVELGARVPMVEVRDQVLAIRHGKGMLLDVADKDTWSAGSFFTNPILASEAAERLPADAPQFPQPGGRVKVSAGWLIAHAGIEPGFSLSPGVAISGKHVLALTNRGQATCAEVVELAKYVRDRVNDEFGVVLTPEPVFVGASL